MSIKTLFRHAALIGTVLLGGRSASARLIGLTTNNSIVYFDEGNPSSWHYDPLPIVGTVSGDTLIGIDTSPTDGNWYVIGKRRDNSARIYRLALISQSDQRFAATIVSTLAADPSDQTNPYKALSGTEFGMDFDPVNNSLRVVSDTRQNLHVEVDSGLVTTDEPLSYATGSPRAGQKPRVGAIAYNNSYEEAPETKLYALDLASQSLATQAPPSNGIIEPFGPALVSDGIDGITRSSFDIFTNSFGNFAIAVLGTNSDPTGSYVYKVDLATGALSFITGNSSTSRFDMALRGVMVSYFLGASVTNTETTENTQTSSLYGLLVRGAPFYKITNIKHGTLYQYDGKTVIPEGSFITHDQGYYGLKFTPAPGFIGNATFDVRASNSMSNVDVSGPIATATIFVVPKNEAPRVVSITPQNASDKVGDKRTFSLTLSDPNGPRDIQQAILLINDRLGWQSGATILYRPNADDPTKGTITLRRGDAFLPEVQVGSGPEKILDNGAVRFTTRDVTVTTSGNNLTINISLTLRDGLAGVNKLFASVVDRKDVRDPAALPADNDFVRFGNYTVTPQFSTGTNVAPTVGRLQPGNVNSGLYGTDYGRDQLFQFSASDLDGLGDIENIIFLINKQRGFAKGAALMFTPRDRRLYLRSDDGKSWLGGAQLGQPNFDIGLANSQVIVQANNARVVVGGDGRSVSLSIPMNPRKGLIGANKIWIRVQDKSGATALNGDDQGYVLSGTWNVAGVSNPAPTTPSDSGS